MYDQDSRARGVVRAENPRYQPRRQGSHQQRDEHAEHGEAVEQLLQAVREERLVGLPQFDQLRKNRSHDRGRDEIPDLRESGRHRVHADLGRIREPAQHDLVDLEIDDRKERRQVDHPALLQQVPRMRLVETPFREPHAGLRAKQQQQDNGRDQRLQEIRYREHDHARAEEYEQQDDGDEHQLRQQPCDRYVAGLHEGIEPVVHDVDRRKQERGAGDRNQGKAGRAGALISAGVQQQGQVARQHTEKLQQGRRAKRLGAQLG